MKHLHYLWYIIRHKWFVFVECCKLGIPLRGILHDWSKLLPDEWWPYTEYFYGEKIAHPTWSEFDEATKQFRPKMVPPDHVAEAFDRAWNLHQKRQPHHWQYWLLSPDNPRPNFGLTSHGPEEIYGLEITHYATAKVVFYKGPEEVNDQDKNRHDVTLLELELEEDFWNTPVPLDMPMRYRKEMLADWRGAGRAITGKDNTRNWYLMNHRHIFLHRDTRAWIEQQLGVVK